MLYHSVINPVSESREAHLDMLDQIGYSRGLREMPLREAVIFGGRELYGLDRTVLLAGWRRGRRAINS